MVRRNLDTKAAPSSIRISFTDQRLTAQGGLIVWSHFLHQNRFRHQSQRLRSDRRGAGLGVFN